MTQIKNRIWIPAVFTIILVVSTLLLVFPGSEWLTLELQNIVTAKSEQVYDYGTPQVPDLNSIGSGLDRLQALVSHRLQQMCPKKPAGTVRQLGKTPKVSSTPATTAASSGSTATR